MGDPKVISIKQSVFASNDAQAELLRRELKEKGIYLKEKPRVSSSK